MRTTATTGRIDLLAAAARVADACTPKRNVTLTDEFGPFRGRPFLLDETDVTAAGSEELGFVFGRAQVAWAIAG